MGIKKDDILKKVIQKVELDKPAPDFTALVMKEVIAECQGEVIADPVIKSLLKRYTIEKPSADFTRQVMTQVVSPEGKTAYKPIITKKVWYFVATLIVFLLFMLDVSEKVSTSPQGLTSYFSVVGRALNSIFTSVSGASSLYLLTFIAIGVLLLADYFLTNIGWKREQKSQTPVH